MVWIETRAQANINVRGEPSDVFALVCDVPTVGGFALGVDRIDDLGDNRYRWVMTARRAVGTVFRPEYVSQYHSDGKGELRFESIEGNVKANGVWRVSGGSGAVRLSLEVTSSVDVPIPRLLKKPAELFARLEASRGVDTQLKRIKERIERG